MKNNLKYIHAYPAADLMMIRNNGKDIIETNYYQSALAKAGLMYLSINDGAFRLLIPPQLRAAINEMRRGAKYILISRGQWQGRDCIEWLAEDNSDTPFVCYIEIKVCDRGFTHSDVGTARIASVWDCRNGQPYKCFELPAYCQIVDRLPSLKRINN